ncbi:MAG: amidohydrolase family protein [Cellvibrionaceae bacterium]
MLDKYPLFDTHMHIIDKRFPLVSNNGYLPEEFTCQHYLNRVSSYQLSGGVIVSGSFQAFDQTYLIDALKTLGPSFVGVTQLPASVTDNEIEQLNNVGVKAVRFNLKRGGSEGLAHLESMARRVFDICGWHVELYVDSKDLEALYPSLITLPSVSIDHLGLSKAGFDYILRLAEKGINIKATGFSRVDFDVASALKAIYQVNPTALMFGTDLPSTRAPSVYSDNDFLMIVETLGEQAAENILSKNAMAFYRV